VVVEHLFNSNALCAVDGAGRVSLPLFVRLTVERRSEATVLMIGPHDADPCLSAYDRGYARFQYADIERHRLSESGSDRHYERARRVFGFVEEACYDAAGAITLPAIMRRKGRIGDLALFVGTGATVEIWNPQLALASDDEALRELAAWRLEDHLASTH
jgi:MraZ protein